MVYSVLCRNSPAIISCQFGEQPLIDLFSEVHVRLVPALRRASRDKPLLVAKCEAARKGLRQSTAVRLTSGQLPHRALKRHARLTVLAIPEIGEATS